MGADPDLRMVPEPAVGRQRLGLEDVEHRVAGLVAVQSGPQRVLVNQAAAADVDQDRARLHGPEEGLVAHAAGLVVERAGQDHDVGLGQHAGQVLQRQTCDRPARPAPGTAAARP